MKIKKLTLLFLIIHIVKLNAQSPEGFWAVNRVTVGEEVRTPVAKWFRLNPDSTFQSGNGWLQNGAGRWQQFSDSTLLFINERGEEDEYGAFEVSFTDGKMYWRRTEDGLPVTVILSPAEKLPKSPADQIVGFWELVKTPSNQHSSILGSEGSVLFIRWDREYRLLEKDKRKRGFWHINAHRPELTLLSAAEEGNKASFTVDLSQPDRLELRSTDSEEQSWIFERHSP